MIPYPLFFFSELKNKGCKTVLEFYDKFDTKQAVKESFENWSLEKFPVDLSAPQYTALDNLFDVIVKKANDELISCSSGSDSDTVKLGTNSQKSRKSSKTSSKINTPSQSPSKSSKKSPSPKRKVSPKRVAKKIIKKNPVVLQKKKKDKKVLSPATPSSPSSASDSSSSNSFSSISKNSSDSNTDSDSSGGQSKKKKKEKSSKVKKD